MTTSNAFTIKSRKLDREFNFELIGGYVYCDGDQICIGGGFRGDTISTTQESFKSECKKWYASHVRKMTAWWVF